MMPQSLRSHTDGRGFSLVELLVVIGTIGVLVGLTLPAVQSARESARRAQCLNKLGQLIRATHSFESVNGGFPPSATSSVPSRGRGPYSNGVYSVQFRLLPFLEQSDLYNSVNFPAMTADITGLEMFHKTAALRVIDVFLCPSDPNQALRPLAPNSYRANTGLGNVQVLAPRHIRPIDDGCFANIDNGTGRLTRLAGIKDGLSNTLAFSEKPIGSGRGGTYSPFRDWSRPPDETEPYTTDEWVSACSHLTGIAPKLTAGGSWMIPGVVYTHFHVNVPPNSRIPDCGYGGWFGGVFAARSYHPGGVNAALADGSARWFTSGTSAQVWRSLGTRAGGEVVSE